MDDLPFDKPGRFFKGNLHTHSTGSDGKLNPVDVIARYRDRGYDFLALTDHFWSLYDFPVTDTTPYRTDGFTTLIGAELHCGGTPYGGGWSNGLWHIIALGLPLDFAPTRDDETVHELTARAAASGAWISLAHPGSQGFEPHHVLEVENIDAVEVYNSGAEYYDERGDGWYLADGLAARGRKIGCVAVDDAHFDGRPHEFTGFVLVKAEEGTPEALLAALKARHYYASQGPEIHDIAVVDNMVTVRCSPAESIIVAGRGSAAPQWHYGENVTEHSFAFDGGFCDGYLRVTVRDHAGRRAWSNPFFFGQS
ncbi:CehA/McbA family metallohydrolase [Nocardia sp. NPDC004711]